MRSTILCAAGIGSLLLLSTAFASGMTVYMSNDDEIDAESAWQEKGKVFVRINKDLLLDFTREEVNLEKTFPARVGVKKKKDLKKKPSTSDSSRIAEEKPVAKPATKPEPTAPAALPVKGETLVLSLPKDYRIDFQERQGNMQLTEMVPSGQSVKNWTEMLTSQVFYGGVPQGTPEGFFRAIDAHWKKSCPDSEGHLIRSGEQDGYPYAFWMEFCPENPGTKKPEVTQFKAIKGKDSFYLVQKAWKYNPKKEDVAAWSSFMGRIRVQDSRINLPVSVPAHTVK